MLNASELDIAREWLSAISHAAADATGAHTTAERALDEVLTLQPDQTIHWAKDEKWSRMMDIASDLAL